MTTQAVEAPLSGHTTRTGTHGVTLAHFAWAAMFLSVLIWGLGGELRKGELGNTGNWYRIGLVLFAAASASLALVGNARRLARAFPGPIALLLAYGVFAMVSSLYIPRHSYYSMWKGFEVVVDVLAIAAVLSHRAPFQSARRAYYIVVGLFGVLIAVAAIEAVLLPDEALSPSRGVIPFTIHGVAPSINANALAFMCAVVLFWGWCRLVGPSPRAIKLVLGSLLACALVVLVLAQSRTSLFGLTAAIAVYLLACRRFVLFATVAMAAAVVALFTPFAEVAHQYVIRGQSNELFASLSGRTRGWQLAWEYFQQSPLFGHGFAAAARSEILGTGGASTLHGAFFDVLVGVGLVGVLLWGTAIAWTAARTVGLLRRARRWRTDVLAPRAVAEMLGVLTLLLVRTTTSSGLAFHEHEFLLFLSVAAFVSSAAAELQRARTAPVGGLLEPARSTI